jgi:hypothetical protein
LIPGRSSTPSDLTTYVLLPLLEHLGTTAGYGGRSIDDGRSTADAHLHGLGLVQGTYICIFSCSDSLIVFTTMRVIYFCISFISRT